MTHAQPPDLALVTQVLHRLRAEQEATEDPGTKAILLHELGVLQEAMGDEAGSARDQLGAVNADADFREPLERLISIIERRQSYKNLGKLLERLARVAESKEERARALLDQAAFVSDHEADEGRARTLLEQATHESPDDARLWLSLELSACKTNDADLRDRALEARARLASPPLWKALLLIDLGELRSAAGEAESARIALEQAVALDTAATFEALEAQSDFARLHQLEEVEEGALEKTAAALELASSNPEAGDRIGVPHHRRSAAHAAAVWLGAADLRRKRGDPAGAILHLERALALLPSDPLLTHARSQLAELAGDLATSRRLAQAELARGASGKLAAALELRLAEAAAAEGDAAGARSAIERALAHDPDGIPARALYLDISASAGDAQTLAAALESTAERLPSDAAKARYYLSAAEVFARAGNDAQGAKAALSQAALAGSPLSLVARLARMLAALGGDRAWYEEATRRLIAQGASAGETCELWFELGRARGLRGDLDGARAAFDALGKTENAWLGAVLAAYVMPLASPFSDAPESGPGATVSALERLAQVLGDDAPAMSRALLTLATALSLAAGEAAHSEQRLALLHGEDASDLVIARTLASRRLRAGDVNGSCLALEASAEASPDPELSSAWLIESGILRFRSADRAGGLACFERAEARLSGAATRLVTLAERSARPDDVGSRRRVLEAAEGEEKALAVLERFGLELGRDGSSLAAADALDTVLDDDAPPELMVALTLARSLWGTSDRDRDRRRDALEELGELSREAAATSSAAAFVLALSADGAAGSTELSRAAERWAATDGSAVAASEWLAATSAARDLSGEVEARRGLAGRLSGKNRAVMSASADLVSFLAGDELTPPTESSEPSIRLANLERAGPGADPRRRASALLGLGNLLGDSSETLAFSLAGMNQLAYGDAAGALDSFRRVVSAEPEDLSAWEGLRIAAEAVGDRASLAEACAALGDAVSDSALGGSLWSKAAFILLDEQGDEAQGEFALARAVERDIKQAAAFDRLFRSVRKRKDDDRLLELITRRLTVAEKSEEITKLFWERARVLRGKGDREGALAALENVRLLEADHVGALALAGEIFITLGRFAEAAENLAALASQSAAPTQQRLMSGVAAVDLYENKLAQPARALEVLVGLHEAQLSTLPVRERLAKVAAKAGDYEQAVRTLELLMDEREGRSGRIEAARLAMVIYRDRLQRPTDAERAISKLLAEAPDDAEALDLLLAGAFPAELCHRLALAAEGALRPQLATRPLDADRIERLAQVALYLGNMPERQAALGALSALGRGSPAIDKELAALDRRVASVPKIAIDERKLPELADPRDGGAIAELMRSLATTIADALGPSLQTFGVSKKERIDPRSGIALRNEIAAWAGALGVGEFDLYVGGHEPRGIHAVASEPPALVVGRDVKAPLSAAHRQDVARELYSLRRGTTILGHREPDAVAALIVAGCRLGDVEIASPPFALIGDFQRQLSKEVSRRVRKLLPQLAAAVAKEGTSPTAWCVAALSSLDRMSAIAAGDVSFVLGGERRLPVGDGQGDRARAERLLAFVLSPSYLDLRDQLGMGVR